MEGYTGAGLGEQTRAYACTLTRIVTAGMRGEIPHTYTQACIHINIYMDGADIRPKTKRYSPYSSGVGTHRVRV